MKVFQINTFLDEKFKIVSLSLIFSSSFSGGYNYDDDIKFLGDS